METPTISKTQRKSTLSAKKTRIKETIKNVVAAPFNNSYWPQISPEDLETLKRILQNNLPRVKPKKVNIPWKLLKDIPKPDRKTFRNNYSKSGVEISKDDRKGLILGINDVTKLLDNNLMSAILISSNVQPRIMVQHVIDEAVLYRVPIIVFDDLRNLLSSTCGVSSSVMGISKDVNSQSKLNLIKENIQQIFEKCPQPVNHINYKRSLPSVDAAENPQVKGGPRIIEKKLNLKEKGNEINSDLSDDLESKIYLKRESKDKRVFVPEYFMENVKVHKMEVDSTGFLPFSETSIPKTETQPVKTQYKSLVVKRLKGDPNRNKRKIASLKGKSKK